jgi:hypothetical protein
MLHLSAVLIFEWFRKGCNLPSRAWSYGCFPLRTVAENNPDEGPDEGREGRYANEFHIGHNAFEVVFEFGQGYEGYKQPVMHTKIVTSPAYAKGFLELLAHSMAEYESRFGPISARGHG